MSGFRARQFGLIGLLIVFLLIAMAASQLFQGFLLPLLYPQAPYLNGAMLAALIIYGSMGLATLFRTSDRGWPWFVGLVGLWILVVSFEDSILQWFTFQFGAQFSGPRINAIQITASAAAVGCAVLLHANMLARGMREGFVERGIEPQELTDIEAHAEGEARGVVIKLVMLIGAASAILFVLQFALLNLSLGLGVLGILAGIVIVTIISVLAFQALRKGPVPSLTEATTGASERRERRPPPGGLR